MNVQEHVRNEPSDVPNAEVHLRGSGGQLRAEDLLAARQSAAREGGGFSLNYIPYSIMHYAADAQVDAHAFVSVHSFCLSRTVHSLSLCGEGLEVGDSSGGKDCLFLFLIFHSTCTPHAQHK